eukprot:6210054-Pleurochrysis_carterae.AAC.1
MQIYCWSRNTIQRVEKVSEHIPIKHGRRATANPGRLSPRRVLGPSLSEWAARREDLFGYLPDAPHCPRMHVCAPGVRLARGRVEPSTSVPRAAPTVRP